MATKILLYCTKAKPYLSRFSYVESDKKHFELTDYVPLSEKDIPLNGTIVAECEVESEEIKYIGYNCYATKSLTDTELLRYSCFSFDELDYYLNVGNGYASHISNLNVFDRPLELGELKNVPKTKRSYKPTGALIWSNYPRAHCFEDMALKINRSHKLTKAPHNMMWVWHNGELKVLMPCCSIECANILNGVQTILVRKNILKGM